MRELGERQPDAVTGGASRSTLDVVVNFMTKVYKKPAEEEGFFVHAQDRVGVNGVVRMVQQSGSGINDHEA